MRQRLPLLLVCGVCLLASAQECEDVSALKEALAVAKDQSTRTDIEIKGLERALSEKSSELATCSSQADERRAAEEAAKKKLEESRSELGAEVQKRLAEAEKHAKERAEAEKARAAAENELAKLKETLEQGRQEPKTVFFERGVLQVNTSEAVAGLRSYGSRLAASAKDGAAKTTAYASEKAKVAGSAARSLAAKVSDSAGEARKAYVDPVAAKAKVKVLAGYDASAKKAADKAEQADTALLAFLAAKNWTTVAKGYDAAKKGALKAQTEAPKLAKSLLETASSLYAKAEPKALNAVSAARATASHAAESASVAASAKLSALSFKPDLSHAFDADSFKDSGVFLSARLSAKTGIEAKYANAIVAFFVCALAVALLFLAFGLCRFLLAKTATLVFSFLSKTLAFTKTVLAFALLTLPKYLTLDLLPATVVFALKLVVVYPLKLLFSPVTVPLGLLTRALSSSSEKKQPKGQPKSTAAAAPSKKAAAGQKKKAHHAKK